MAGAKIDRERSDGLVLGALKNGPMPSSGIICRRTEGPVGVLGVRFRLDLQMEGTWAEVLGGVTWSGRWLSLKGGTQVASLFVASVIVCCLSVLSCPESRLNGLERVLYCVLWGGTKLLVRRPIRCQGPDLGGLGMP